ncbi:MAG: sigma-70 family RNA polymerase sigma factor [Planctomycetota bacterium]|nr:MAG: sigma-70 family RNA polymerase sigma factor [Planctomycetota bacterium]
MVDETLQPLLTRFAGGDEHAAELLLPEVYGEMRRIARRLMRAQPANHTLQATALVNEAYLKLAGASELRPENRVHLVAIAARAMRQILINYAAGRAAHKRGGGWTQITLDSSVRPTEDAAIDVLALHEALEELERLDERQARVVELRFFGGLTAEEAAEVLRVSPRTVQLEWRMARLWLRRRLEDER